MSESAVAPAATPSAVAHFDALRAAPPTTRRLPAALVDALTTLLGDRFSQSRAVCEHHGIDISSYPVTPPTPWRSRRTATKWWRSCAPAPRIACR